MTRLTTLLAVMILILPIGIFGQKKTYFGIEAAATGDIYKINDPGSEIKKGPVASGFLGVNIKQEIGHKLFLETGLIRKYYSDGVNFKTIPGTSSNNEFNAWFIPVRFGVSVNLISNKLFLIPDIGYNFCINSNYGETDGTGASGSVEESNGNKTSYSYTANYNLVKTFSLLQGGFGLECRLFKTATLLLYSNYYLGFKKIIVLDIDYSTNSSGAQNAEATGKGNMTSFGLKIQYPISSIWTRTKQ